jgi:hypothetical protein
VALPQPSSGDCRWLFVRDCGHIDSEVLAEIVGVVEIGRTTSGPESPRGQERSASGSDPVMLAQILSHAGIALAGLRLVLAHLRH